MSHAALTLLTPPEQFGIVEPGIYRSDMLQPIHFPFIKQLRLKTVVMLSPELPNRGTSNLMEEAGMKLVMTLIEICLLMGGGGLKHDCKGPPGHGDLEANSTVDMAASIRRTHQGRARVDS